MLGFRFYKMADGSDTPAAQPYLIQNSATLQVGDPVKLVAGGGVAPADAVADLIYGFVVGFVVDPGRKNIPIEQVANDSNFVDGTFTPDPQGDTYAASADNLTDKKVAALVIPARGAIFSAKPDAAPGTTPGSDLANYYLDILTTDTSYLDESTATNDISSPPTTAYGQFITVSGRTGDSCIDPTDSTRILVMVNKLQLPGAGSSQAA